MQRTLSSPAADAAGLVVRPAQESDRAFLVDLYAGSRAGELAAVPWTAQAKADFLLAQFEAQDAHYRAHYPNALFLIVEHGGQPIGRLYLERQARTHRLMDVILIPDSQGHGYGRALLADVLADAANAGMPVDLHVEKFNPALAWYQRLGFETIEDKGVYDLMIWLPPVAVQAKTAT